MNKQVVLLYNFDRERLRKVRKVLAPLKATIKTVSEKEFSQPVGYVAEIEGILPNKEKIACKSFTDEMIVMCGFGSEKIDTVIAALKMGGIGKIDLKAVITPSNVYWNSFQLYEAVKSDHMAMNGQ